MRVAAFFTIISVAGIAVAADTVTAKKATTLRRDQNAMSPRVVDVPRGTVLNVVRKDGKWYFADYQGKQGWAAESWLASDSAGPSKGLGQMSQAASGQNSEAGAVRGLDPQKGFATAGGPSEASDAAAVRGIEPLTGDIAKASGYDYRPIQRLIDLREGVINSGELETFGKQGNVGLAKK